MRPTVQTFWKVLLCVGLVSVVLPGRAATVEYIHTDALGSPVAVTNSAGVVIERREYEPYGKQTQPALANGPGFSGHVTDAATGLDYMQQRYYDPGIGRFLSVDPVAANSKTGFNRYSYAGNNPYTLFDPDGRQPACGKNTKCQIDRGATGGTTYRHSGSSTSESTSRGGVATTQSASGGFVSAFTDRNWLTGEGSITDLEALADDLIPPLLNATPEGGGLKLASSIGVMAKPLGRLLSGASVLGHYPGYVRTAESIGARYFSVPSRIWDRMSPTQQWAANSRFLDRLAARGDTIILSTPAAEARIGSWYARELEYMASKGYMLDAAGTRMLPP